LYLNSKDFSVIDSSKTRRYFFMGVVGVGKSTLLKHHEHGIAGCKVFGEWPEATPAGLLNAPDTLSTAHQEALQDWIFSQVVLKNHLVHAASQTYPLLLIDRSPLDTFAFYDRDQWPHRATQLRDHLTAATPPEPLANGMCIHLVGDPATIAARMDKTRGYTAEEIKAQQEAFIALTRELSPQPTVFDTTHLAPDELATQVHALITAGPYHPLNIQATLDSFA
jgi:predicted ATPase